MLIDVKLVDLSSPCATLRRAWLLSFIDCAWSSASDCSDVALYSGAGGIACVDE